jgi:hypothetical protein
MVDIVGRRNRFRRYVPGVELASAGAVVAASMGEPGLAHQLELMRADATPAQRNR